MPVAVAAVASDSVGWLNSSPTITSERAAAESNAAATRAGSPSAVPSVSSVSGRAPAGRSNASPAASAARTARPYSAYSPSSGRITARRNTLASGRSAARSGIGTSPFFGGFASRSARRASQRWRSAGREDGVAANATSSIGDSALPRCSGPRSSIHARSFSVACFAHSTSALSRAGLGTVPTSESASASVRGVLTRAGGAAPAGVTSDRRPESATAQTGASRPATVSDARREPLTAGTCRSPRDPGSRGSAGAARPSARP